MSIKRKLALTGFPAALVGGSVSLWLTFPESQPALLALWGSGVLVGLLVLFALAAGGEIK